MSRANIGRELVDSLSRHQSLQEVWRKSVLQTRGDNFDPGHSYRCDRRHGEKCPALPAAFVCWKIAGIQYTAVSCWRGLHRRLASAGTDFPGIPIRCCYTDDAAWSETGRQMGARSDRWVPEFSRRPTQSSDTDSAGSHPSCSRSNFGNWNARHADPPQTGSRRIDS